MCRPRLPLWQGQGNRSVCMLKLAHCMGALRGVYFLQGFDFLSQWCPVILLFILPGASLQRTWASLQQGAEGIGSLDLGISLGFLPPGSL